MTTLDGKLFPTADCNQIFFNSGAAESTFEHPVENVSREDLCHYIRRWLMLAAKARHVCWALVCKSLINNNEKALAELFQIRLNESHCH